MGIFLSWLSRDFSLLNRKLCLHTCTYRMPLLLCVLKDAKQQQTHLNHSGRRILQINHSHIPFEGCNWLPRRDGWCHWCFPVRWSRNGVNLAPRWAISVQPHPMKDTLVHHPAPRRLSSVLTLSLPAASSHLSNSSTLHYKPSYLHLFPTLYIISLFVVSFRSYQCPTITAIRQCHRDGGSILTWSNENWFHATMARKRGPITLNTVVASLTCAHFSFWQKSDGFNISS